MLEHLPPKERIGYACLGALLLFGVSYVGAAQLKRPAPIVFKSRDAQAKVDAAQPQNNQLVIVHVAGAVKQPGVVRLPEGSRAVDAIHRTGGPAPDADLDRLNLAAKLEDGTQLYVPHKAQKRVATSETKSGLQGSLPPLSVQIDPEPLIDSAYRAGGTQSKNESSTTGKSPKSESVEPQSGQPSVVSLNAASEQELENLPGVGPATAKKILDYRKEHGGFRSIDELLAVKGIGQKKLDKMKPLLRL